MTQVDIKSNLEAVQQRTDDACRRAGRSPGEVTLIAVTKTIDPETIEDAFSLGIRNFGENRVQEAGQKIKALSNLQPHPTWHMIGHLQSNKVKTTLELFDIIHSVDSLELVEVINRYARQKIRILLQVNISGEQTKSGFSPPEVGRAVEAASSLPNLKVEGLMTIAPMVNNPELVRPVFRKLRELRDSFGLKHLSMGMTDDFEAAIEEGATMVRIGRAIFGERV